MMNVKYRFVLIVLWSILLVFSCATQQDLKMSADDDSFSLFKKSIGKDGLDVKLKTSRYKIRRLKESDFQNAYAKYHNPYQEDTLLEEKLGHPMPFLSLDSASESYGHSFKFPNGKRISFHDHYDREADELNKLYRCHGSLGQKAYYVGEETWSGMRAGYWINQVNGEVEEVYEPPIVSPDSHYVVSIDHYYAIQTSEDFGPSGFKVLKYDNGSYKPYAFWAYNSYIIDRLIWIDSQTMALKVFLTSELEIESKAYRYYSLKILTSQ